MTLMLCRKMYLERCSNCSHLGLSCLFLWEIKKLTYNLLISASPRKEGGDKQEAYHT